MAEREVIHFPLWVQLAPRPCFAALIPPKPARELPPVAAPRLVIYKCAQTSPSPYERSLPEVFLLLRVEAES
jgi:hypothetical protein